MVVFMNENDMKSVELHPTISWRSNHSRAMGGDEWCAASK